MLPHRTFFRHISIIFIVATALSACGGNQTKRDDNTEAKQRAEAQQRMEIEFMSGKAAFTTGNIKQAESIFYAMSRAYPGHASVLANLAMVYASKGEVDKAEETFRASLELDPNQPELYNHLGIMYRKKGEFGQAMLKYKEGLEIAPDYPSLLANMGTLYDLYLGQPEEALKFYQRHRELMPDDKQMEIWLADLMQRVMKK